MVSLLAACGLVAPAASAQSPTVIVKVHQRSGLVSPYFQLGAPPGHTVNAGSLEIDNPAPRAVTVRIDPVDAITTDTLGSAYAQTNSALSGAATWLKLSRRSVVVAPHASRSVSVSVAVPATATPGDYLGGVAVEALGQSRTERVGRGVAIGETDRYAIGVEVKLPGARHPAVHFSGASVGREPAGLVFGVNAGNTGNVILKNVHGWVRVTQGDRPVATARIAPGTIVSGTNISYPVPALREQPTPGTSYRVRAALYYSGGVARLDTRVVFSHAAAVKQQNYGGRKLPKHASVWRWLLLAILLLVLIASARKVQQRRRRPLDRREGMQLLDGLLGPDGDRPVSIALLKANRRHNAVIARAIRAQLRRGDRVCDLGRDGVLVICRATERPTANALAREFERVLARHSVLARVPIEISLATANKATTAEKLVNRVKNGQRRHQDAAPARSARRRAATTHKR
ncbi:MAG: WxL protein peptidoglycan domain-containing protein [Solirubrobacteraceae bacterium]